MDFDNRRCRHLECGDSSQVAKYADEWVAVNAGQDGAWWMAVNHVLLTEFHHQQKTKYFLDTGRASGTLEFINRLAHRVALAPPVLLGSERIRSYRGIGGIGGYRIDII